MRSSPRHTPVNPPSPRHFQSFVLLLEYSEPLPHWATNTASKNPVTSPLQLVLRRSIPDTVWVERVRHTRCVQHSAVAHSYTLET